MPIRPVLLSSALLLAQGGATLRWTPKEGDELKYRTVADLTLRGSPVTLSSLNVHKIIKVDEDGTFVVEAKAIEAKITMLGQEMQGGGMTTLTTYGTNGEIKEIRGDRVDATGYRMANLTNFHVPPKAVAVGEGWTSEGKADAKTGAVGWKADYKVVGEETVGTYPALKIDVTSRETEGTEAGKANGSLWVGRDGVLVKSELTWANVAVPGSTEPVSGKIVQTRVP